MSSWVTGEVQPPVTICQLKSRIIVGHEERRFANVANSEGNTQGLQWWCAHLWGTVLVFIFKWKNWAKRKEEFVIMQSWWRRVCLIIVSLWSKGVVQGSPHFLAQAGSAPGCISFCRELLHMEDGLSLESFTVPGVRVTAALEHLFLCLWLWRRRKELSSQALSDWQVYAELSMCQAQSKRDRHKIKAGVPSFRPVWSYLVDPSEESTVFSKSNSWKLAMRLLNI